MRTLLFSLLLALTVVACASTESHIPRRSPSNGGERGGGDTLVADFQALAKEIVGAITEELKLHPSRSEFPAQGMREAIKKVTVRSTPDPIYLHGEYKEAYNSPDENRIVFNRHQWLDMSDSRKHQLVFHEYLGILKLPDELYERSSAIFNSVFGARREFLARYARVSVEANYIGKIPMKDRELCFNLSKLDLYVQQLTFYWMAHYEEIEGDAKNKDELPGLLSSTNYRLGWDFCNARRMRKNKVMSVLTEMIANVPRVATILGHPGYLGEPAFEEAWMNGENAPGKDPN